MNDRSENNLKDEKIIENQNKLWMVDQLTFITTKQQQQMKSN